MPFIGKYKNQIVVDGLQLSQTNHLLLDSGDKLEVNITLADKRNISQQQRKFIFSLCHEIGEYMGEDKDFVRLNIQEVYKSTYGLEKDSLALYSMSEANGLIDLIIHYCIDNKVPVSSNIMKENEFSFSQKHIYRMILNRQCAICGRVGAHIHHVDAIGMGRNRDKISHIGKRALPLCAEHHALIHTKGDEEVIEKLHLEPVVIDEKLELFIKKGIIKIYKDDLKE